MSATAPARPGAATPQGEARWHRPLPLRLVQLAVAAELVVVLVTGGYRVPALSLRSATPVTEVFLLLLLEAAALAWRRRADRAPWTPPRQDALFFLLTYAIYLSNFRWRGSGDVVAASLQPFALLQHGTLHLDAFYRGFLDDRAISWVYVRHGHVFSMYPSTPGLFLLPFCLISALAGVAPTDLLVHQLQKIGAAAMVAGSAVFVLETLALRLPRRTALLLAAAYAFGTAALSTASQAIWQHGPGQLCVAAGLWALVRGLSADAERAWLGRSGLALGLATWCRYSNVWIALAAAAFLATRRPRSLAAYFAWSLPPALALLADNAFHSGSVLRTGYQAQALVFTGAAWSGLAGLLVAPGRGLLLYSPFLAVALAGYARAWRRGGEPLWRWLGLAALATWLFYGFYRSWAGGWCFGPRYLADVAPLLVLGFVPWLEGARRGPRAGSLVGLLVGVSILVHALGAYLTWWWERIPTAPWRLTTHPVPYLLARLARGGPTEERAAGAVVALTLLVLLAGFARDWSRGRDVR